MRCVQFPSDRTFREATRIAFDAIKVLNQLDGDTQTGPKTWCAKRHLSPQSTDTWKNQRYLNTFSGNSGWTIFLHIMTRNIASIGSRMSAQRENMRQQLDWQVVYRRRALVATRIGVHCMCFERGKTRSELCRGREPLTCTQAGRYYCLLEQLDERKKTIKTMISGVIIVHRWF
jgi:hypothetical protein